MKRTSNKGFTLIEMLVVCLIVVLLAGLVFRMTSAVSRANSIAKTKAKLDMVANALEEFKAIYGKYPPVQMKKRGDGPWCPFYYEYPSGESFDKDTAEITAERLVNEGRAYDENWGYEDRKWNSPDKKARDNFFTFGVCSYFVPRVNGTAGNGPRAFRKMDKCTQWNVYNDRGAMQDSQRDLDAVRRILPHLGARLAPDGTVDTSPDGCILELNSWHTRIFRGQLDGSTRTNNSATVFDDWDKDLCYWSVPPYETFKLWSSGPNQADEDGEGDDIVWGTY